MFKKILVAVDGSQHGQKAARVAGEMTRRYESELWIVVAYDVLPKYLGEPNLQEAITQRVNQSEEIYAGATQEIGEISQAVHKEILEGPAAEAILSVADACNVDLIIMGTRGLGGLTSVLLGSQSQKVVGQASCPVLLIR